MIRTTWAAETDLFYPAMVFAPLTGRAALESEQAKAALAVEDARWEFCARIKQLADVNRDPPGRQRTQDRRTSFVLLNKARAELRRAYRRLEAADAALAAG